MPLFVKSQPICGPLGPKFDGSCANNGTKTKSGTFGPWNFRFCGVICTEAIKVRPQWTTNWLKFHIWTAYGSTIYSTFNILVLLMHHGNS